VKKLLAIKAVIAGSALALLATPADAAVYRYNQPVTCYEFEGGSSCYGSTGQFNIIENSGVYGYTGQAKLTYSYTSPSSTYSGSFTYKNIEVFTRGSSVSRQTWSNIITTNGSTCTIEATVLFAGGKIHIEEVTNDCIDG
jgi:hypothetical protein